MPSDQEELPSTVARSPAKVRRTYEKTLDSATEQYGDEQRAHRTAWAAVKHVAEKTGDHWELKGVRRGGAAPTRRQLYAQARELGVEGRSRMSRDELEQAVADRAPRRGPSDPQAEGGAGTRPRRTYGGVDANKPKRELLGDAAAAGIPGRTRMTKHQLAEALQRYNDRQTARARAR